MDGHLQLCPFCHIFDDKNLWKNASGTKFESTAVFQDGSWKADQHLTKVKNGAVVTNYKRTLVGKDPQRLRVVQSTFPNEKDKKFISFADTPKLEFHPNTTTTDKSRQLLQESPKNTKTTEKKEKSKIYIMTPSPRQIKSRSSSVSSSPLSSSSSSNKLNKRATRRQRQSVVV